MLPAVTDALSLGVTEGPGACSEQPRTRRNCKLRRFRPLTTFHELLLARSSFHAFGKSHHIISKSGRPSTSTSCGPFSWHSNSMSQNSSACQARPASDCRRAINETEAFTQPCRQTQPLHADRLPEIKDAQPTTHLLRARRNAPRQPSLIGNRPEGRHLRILHSVDVQRAGGVPSTSPIEQTGADNRAGDLHPTLLGETPLTQDLLARGLVRRSCGGSASCELQTSPCFMGGLCSQVPMRACQSELGALRDLDGWRPLTVHEPPILRAPAVTPCLRSQPQPQSCWQPCSTATRAPRQSR